MKLNLSEFWHELVYTKLQTYIRRKILYINVKPLKTISRYYSGTDDTTNATFNILEAPI